MNKSIFFFFLITSISIVMANCQSDKPNFVEKRNTPEVSPKKIDNTFDVILKIDKINNKEFLLEYTIELGTGSYIASPFSKDGFYGPTSLSVEKNNMILILENELSENPESKEEYDPYIEKQVKFVKTNTTYQQKIKLKSKEDFKITGDIFFVLEPICIPYEIKFEIIQKDGDLIIEKTSTDIHESYKGK